MTFLPVHAIVNLRMLFLLIGACCILVGVNGGWDEEVGLLRRGRGGAGGGYQREFDYFKLSLQWPGTYCRRTRRCCSSNACCSRYISFFLFFFVFLWKIWLVVPQIWTISNFGLCLVDTCTFDPSALESSQM